MNTIEAIQNIGDSKLAVIMARSDNTGDRLKRRREISKRQLRDYVNSNQVKKTLLDMGLEDQAHGCTIHGDNGPVYYIDGQHPKSRSRKSR